METKYLRYNKDLVNRFISDYKLPISVNLEKYFFYFLNLYEDKYKSASKWKTLWNLIDGEYGGDEKKFLDEYYKIRDRIITSISESNAYQEFNTMDMSHFSVINKDSVSTNNIYNCENIGKYFLSIDLKKANFQALKFVNSEIVLNADTYEDFIGKFTDLQYIKESKYTRQVIFGKLNPKRHITVEKYIIRNVWKKYTETFSSDLHIVSLSNDEIVIESDIAETYNTNSLKRRIKKIEDSVKEDLGIEVKAEYFRLDGYQLCRKETGECRTTFFTKTDLVSGEVEFMCVPLPYFAIVYKLYNGLTLSEYDYHFIYENIDCKFMEEFEIRKI